MTSRIGISAVAAAISLAVLPAMAATTHSLDGRFTYAAPGRRQTAPFALPAGANILFNNFANAYPNGLYFGGLGNSISGPGVLFNPGISPAAQFTPTKSGTATLVYAAVGYISGNSLVDVSIYTDNGGVPGTTLSSVETTVSPGFGACCQVIKAKLTTGVALTAGTPYWVVMAADDPTNSTFNGAWAVSTINQVATALTATNFNGAGWNAFPTTTPPAFAVIAN